MNQRYISRHRIVYAIFTIILFLYAGIVSAYDDTAGRYMNESDFTFTHLGTNEGPASQRVYSIRQTKDGAVWWTTKRGVDRTNGAKIRHYSLGQRTTYSSFAGRVVRFAQPMTADATMYVFDNSGRIFLYNEVQDRFDQVYDASQGVKGDVVINDVMVAKDCMWLAMSGGIYKLDRSSGKVSVVRERLFTECIIRMNDGTLLFCTTQGVMKLTFGDRLVKFLPYHVLSGYHDSKTGELWLGTFSEGVKICSRNGVTALEGWIPSNPVRSIVPYGKNMMLIGIDGYGVYQAMHRVPVGTQRVARPLFSATEGPYGVLHGNGVYAIMEDSWHNIIVGTYSGGIDVARPVGSTTAVFSHSKNNQQSIINNHVNCVYPSGDGIHLLMGTDDGISVYETLTRNWKHIARGQVVLDICSGPDNRLLIATYGSGIFSISMDGAMHREYSTEDGTLDDNHVYSIMYDRDGNFWIGTLFGDLTVRMKQGGTKRFRINNVTRLRQLHDGRMAVATTHGLYLLRLSASQPSTTPREVSYLPAGTTDINRFINDIYEDNRGKLWIATDGGGVYIHDLKTGKTDQVTKDDGLPSNSVCNVIRDATGRIWFGTERGLAFANPLRPHEVVDVNYCYGLQTEYIPGAVATLRSGRVLYGTVEGAVIIDPSHIQKLNYTAKLGIRGVRVMSSDNAMQQGGRTWFTTGTPTDMEELEQLNEQVYRDLQSGCINLSYSQRSFELYYESINLRNQFDIAYQYKMGENEWSTPTDEQHVLFENLEPGVHTLHIRSISKTSMIVLDERVLTVTISQPWWRSWWMTVIYVLLIAMAFYGAWRVYDLHNKYMRLTLERVEGRHDDNEPSAPLHTGQTDAPEEPVPSHMDTTLPPSVPSPSEGETATVTDTPQEPMLSAEPDDEQPASSDGEDFVNRATKIILDNLMDTDFTIDNLCREMAMSRTLFYVKLKTYTGKSPQDFVRLIRLERAARLLRQGRTVSDVSMLVGFDNPKYFSTVFKKYFGVSPSKYK